MSKEQINEMKKFMQIAEGDREDFKQALKNPLAKATKLFQKVVDGLGREWEELMNTGDEEDKDFADTIDGDMDDYKKLVAMLEAGKGKQAAKFYDRLDTVAREYIYDHLESDELTYLQKVFDKLGSTWLFMDEYFEESADKCEKCGREGCECGPDCDCEPVDDSGLDLATRSVTDMKRDRSPGYDPRTRFDIGEGFDEEGMGHYNVTVAVDENYPDDIEIDLSYPEAVQAAGELAKQFQKGRWEMKTYKMQDAVEWQIKWDSKDDTHLTVIRVEPSDEAEWAGSPFESIELESIAESILSEDYDEGTESCLWCNEEGHTEDECYDFPFATDMDYEMDWDTGEIHGYDPEGREIAARPGREVRYLDAPPRDPVPCPVCDGTAIDVGHGYECEDCGETFTWVGSPFDNALSEDSYADWEEPGQDEPAATGKSDAVKKAADELGLDVVDMPLSDPDDDEELGLRFD